MLKNEYLRKLCTNGLQPNRNCSEFPQQIYQHILQRFCLEWVVLGVRPEFLKQQDENAVDAQVESSLPSGMETILVTKVGAQRMTSVIFGDVDFKSGENLKMGFSGNKYQLFNGDTGMRLTSGSLKV